MGLNICVEKCTIDEKRKVKAFCETETLHGTVWNSCRQWYDYEFADLEFNKEYVHVTDMDSYWRPESFEEIRSLIKAQSWAEEGKTRYFYLIDLLEQNNDYWVWFMY